jgi:hypothetical protein
MSFRKIVFSTRRFVMDASANHIEDLLKMLQSPKADQRYEACEELRVMPDIPEEAKTALKSLLTDPDPDVADSARRALKIHTEQALNPSSEDTIDYSKGIPFQPEDDGWVFFILKNKIIFLLTLPILMIGLIFFFNFQERAFQKSEAEYQALRNQAWERYPIIQVPTNYKGCNEIYKKFGGIEFDQQNRAWVVGGCGRIGIHVYNDGQWMSYTQDNSNLAWAGYQDIDISSSGQIWALANSGEGVEVFDGKQWKAYTPKDLGLPDGEIFTLEAGTQDQIWMWVKYDEEGIPKKELGVFEKGTWTPFFNGYFEFEDGGWPDFLPIDVDPQGRVWVPIQAKYISIFDGKTVEEVPYTLWKSREMAGVAFDNQSNPWVATSCGDIITRTDGGWQEIRKNEYYKRDPANPCENGGDFQEIVIDKSDRVWIWGGGINVLIGGSWKKFETNEYMGRNSILDYDGIISLTTDQHGQVWIYQGGGEVIKLISDENIVLPDEYVNNMLVKVESRKQSDGYGWYLPSIFGLLWLGILLNKVPGFLIAIGLGFLSLMPFGGAPMDQ